jgi:hypothetical protein
VSPGSQTTPRTKARGKTVSPSGQTTPRIEAGSHTTTLGGPTAWTCAAPSSPASLTSHPLPPRGTHEFGYAPCGTLDSTHATRGPGVYDYGHTTHNSTSAVATCEGGTGGTSGQSSFDDHVGEAGASGFRPTHSPCRPSQHQPCRWYPPPSAPPSLI